MKIEQNPEFQPITITLETAEEAEALWRAVRDAETVTIDKDRFDILRELSDWFTTEAQLINK